ncbi:NAD-dependent epimerase/dehydratase family protein [Hymenobacter busanensis]|uniref:NAD-dependent epimerase/dehydratase family protein n=1 Tax=Hymenobacter busanensis TaxID=2607656 RepID=A0A7L4ZTD3_9BACT|nr:GDP-mannose 4,6-dehydratase [Hymenobacter busanensis]KAA9339859.1 NAD-dependent epimerase/dehydratase family protein [Hymenobacter busanensis]QHJ06388.1 NAD-dependent epimerase/dehydratase family protein [Hymenobacter busanensis]
MHTVLVTGCAGFIGSHLCERLLADGFNVVGLDNFDPFYPRPSKERNLATLRNHARFAFHELDLRQGPTALQEAIGSTAIDVVVHLAAKAGVGPSVNSPVAYLDNNLLGTAHLLEWMRTQQVTRLLFASSSSVYGNTERRPFREDEQLQQACISPYATSKLAGEELTYTYHHLHGLSVLNTRFFTVYGPRQRPDLAIHKFARLLLAGKPIPVYGDGSTARDYTFVGDTVEGIVRGIQYLLTHPGCYETVNLGNNRPVALLELIEAIGQALQIQPQLEYQPMQAGDVDVTFADLTKAQTLLGYAPHTPLAEGLAQFVAWLRATPTEA